MKKNVFYGLGFAFLTLGMTSCGKSTTGKITNDWTIVSQEEEQTIVNPDGEKNYSKSSYTETTVLNYSEHTPSAGATTTSQTSGIVTTNAIEIKKDGTWTWNQELKYNENMGGGTISTQVIKNIQSGKWSFVKKSKGEDFKKNERISMEALERTSSILQTVNGVLAQSGSTKSTYAPGESIAVYTVVKSNNKELELKLDLDYQSVVNGDVTRKEMTRTIKLKEN